MLPRALSRSLPYQRPGSGTPGRGYPIVNQDATPALPGAGLVRPGFPRETHGQKWNRWTNQKPATTSPYA